MVLFEIHQRFKGHFLNELRISFNVEQKEKRLNSQKLLRENLLNHLIIISN